MGDKADHKDLMEALAELSEAHRESAKRHEEEVEKWWQALSEEEREKAFYAVVQRIHKAELTDRRSFRGAIYDVFGFGPGMYGVAMDCGYMNIHNAIFDGEEFMAMQSAKQFEVKDSNDILYTWPDVQSLNIQLDEESNKLVVLINKGNPYV